MTTVTESDIKELKELITAQTERLNAISKDFSELSKNVTDLSKDVTDLKISDGKIEAVITERTYQAAEDTSADLSSSTAANSKNSRFNRESRGT